MASRIYAKINKDTLRFIRGTKQVSFDYINRITGFSEEKILLWEDENSSKLPTINQAKELAACYHVPFAAFYMSKDNININHLPHLVNKRTMSVCLMDDSAVNLAVIDLLNERDFYIETKNQLHESIPSLGLIISDDLSIAEWARAIRTYFELDIDEQYKTSSKRRYYLYLRGKIESKGVFVQGFRGVDVGELRGVAIRDESMPIIGINDKDRYPAKSFSIIHELVHIIKRSSSICNDMFGTLSPNDEEVFCNAVAGEVLAPKSELLKQIKKFTTISLTEVDAIAKKFSVSAEVIARRLLDVGVCKLSWYKRISDELERRFYAEREELKMKSKMGLGDGPRRNMAREAVDRTSSSLCEALLRGYSEGIFDKADISSHIGIGQKHITKFATEVMGWYL